MNIMLVITLILLATSKGFIITWVYKDAKSKGINPLIWTILLLVFSGTGIFLLYILVIRKGKDMRCKNCNFAQSDKLLYCGRCGHKIAIKEQDEALIKDKNKKFLNIGIILLVIAIVTGVLFAADTIWKDEGNIPISFMSVSNKYNNKWNDKFKYKNGKESYNFKIKEKTRLNASWDLEDGDMEVELYSGNTLIKKINASDYPNHQEIIDLSKYKGSKVLLGIRFKKAAGKIAFFLE